MRLVKRLNWLLISAIALLAGACGTHEQATSLTSSANESLPAETGLRLLPGTLADHPGVIELTVEWSEVGQDRIVVISGSKISQLTALYVSLPLENANTYEAGIDAADWAGSDALSLALPAGNTELHIGIAMLHPHKQEGFSGAGELARIRLTWTETLAANRGASAAPVSAQSRIDLDFDPASNHFFFHYRNQGDYDQNSEVNISDLTPLAVHFGKVMPGGWPVQSIESVVDGDGNGEINLADITPIGAGFGRRQDAFNIYQGLPDQYPVAPTDVSSIVPIHKVMFDETDTPAHEGRLYYDVVNPEPPSSSDGYWLRPTDGGLEGIASEIAGLGNQSPVVQLTTSETIGVTPLEVNFDAGASTDPEGGPLEYRWYFFDQTNPQPVALADPGGPALAHTVEQAGNYAVVLIVRDEDGAQAARSVNIKTVAQAGWEISTVIPQNFGDSVDEVFDVSLAAVAGNPYMAVSYKSGNAGRITVGDVGISQSGFDDFNLVYSDANVLGAELELLDMDGTLGLAGLLKRATDGLLDFYSMNEDGGFDSPPGFIAPATGEYRDISAALIDGRPALSYHHVDDADLMFLHSTNPLGSAWSAPVAVDDLGDTGTQTNLAQIGGTPSILYYTDGGLRIRYVEASLSGGVAVWDPPFTLQPLPGARLMNALLELPSGEPWMLYHDTNAMELTYSTGANFQNSGLFAATDGDPANFVSAKVIGGRVCVAWYEAATDLLMFVRSADETGTNWETPQPITVDTLTLSMAPALAEIDGRPGVAYFDAAINETYYSLLVEE